MMKKRVHFWTFSLLLYLFALLPPSPMSAQGAALNFDGTNDYIESANKTGISGTASRTIEAWIKTTSTVPQIIVDIGGSATAEAFALATNNVGNIVVFSGGRLTGPYISDGSWHHVAVVYDDNAAPNKVALYLDGSLATLTGSVVVNSTDSKVFIGSKTDGEINHFSGNIDEVKVWNRALTACEVQTYKNCEHSGSPTGLVLYYKFNQGVESGTNTTVATVTDYSGNANTGTLTNFALTGSTSNWVKPGGVVSGTTCPATSPIPTPPSVFNVTGGGAYCDGGTGVAIGLDGSQTGVSYQFQKNGVDDGAAVLGTGSVLPLGNKIVAGTYTVVATKTAGGCPMAMTGSAMVSITPSVSASVSIVAELNNNGTSGIFTATPVNGGATPSYQWKNGATNVGTNSNTYTNTALMPNDVITCVMTSSITCAPPAISNAVTITTCNCDPMCSTLETMVGEPKVSIARFDGTTYTHYCTTDNKLLLSLIIPTGTTISPNAVKVKIEPTVNAHTRWCGATIAAAGCFLSKTDGNALISRFWHIDAAGVTGTITSANFLQVVSYFSNADFLAMNAAILTVSGGVAAPSVTSLRVYQPKIGKFGIFPNPTTTGSTLNMYKYNNGTNPSTFSWKHNTYQSNINAAEFQIIDITNSFGIGKY